MRLLAAQDPACRAAFLLTERMDAWPTVNLTHRVGGRPDTVNELVYETSAVMLPQVVVNYRTVSCSPIDAGMPVRVGERVIELWKL